MCKETLFVICIFVGVFLAIPPIIILLMWWLGIWGLV